MNSNIVGSIVTAEPQYPVLKKSSEPLCGWEYVVLFSAPRTGMVVHIITQGDKKAPPSGEHLDVGYYSDSFGEDSFEKFNGTIELSN